MSYSANELQSLAQKAAMGAGFPPAQAETYGKAVAVHLGEGQDAAVLSNALDDPSDSPILRLPLLLDDILRAIAVLGPDVTLSLHPKDVALAGSYARLLPLQLHDIKVETREEGQPRLHLRADPKTPRQIALPPRIAAPGPLVERLQSLAARTYVPASAASRNAGAGAGNIDND